MCTVKASQLSLLGWCCYCLVPKFCATLFDPMDYSLPGSSVHGISPGKNTGVGCHFLLWGIFLTQGSNPRLLPWQVYSLLLSHQGSPIFTTRFKNSINLEKLLYHSSNLLLFFLLEENCFAMLCWFLLFNNMNQLQLYTLFLEPPTPPPSHPSRSQECQVGLPGLLYSLWSPLFSLPQLPQT